MLPSKPRMPYFGLHRRVALQTTYRHQVLEIESQFTQFGDLALHEKGHLLGVETAGEIVEGHLDYILAYLSGLSVLSVSA